MSLDQKHTYEALDTAPVRSILPPLQFDPRQADPNGEMAERFTRSLDIALETALKLNADKISPLPETVVEAAVRLGFQRRVDRNEAAADRFYRYRKPSDTTRKLYALHDFTSTESVASYFVQNRALDEIDLGAQVYSESTSELPWDIHRQLKKYFITMKEEQRPRLKLAGYVQLPDNPDFNIVITDDDVAKSKAGFYVMTREKIWVQGIDAPSPLAHVSSTPIMESISVKRDIVKQKRSVGNYTLILSEVAEPIDTFDLYDS